MVNLIVPNQLNIKIGAISLFFTGVLSTIFEHNCISEFDKNANSINTIVLIALYIELVWRLSEFVFFVRLLRWSHFLFLLGEFRVVAALHTCLNYKN